MHKMPSANKFGNAGANQSDSGMETSKVELIGFSIIRKNVDGGQKAWMRTPAQPSRLHHCDSVVIQSISLCIESLVYLYKRAITV